MLNRNEQRKKALKKKYEFFAFSEIKYGGWFQKPKYGNSLYTYVTVYLECSIKIRYYIKNIYFSRLTIRINTEIPGGK